MTVSAARQPPLPAVRSPGTAAAKVRRGRIWLGYGLTLLVYGLLMHLWQAEPVGEGPATAAMVLAAVCAFPLALWMARGRPGAPMFELICLAYGAQYSAPVFLQPNSITILSRFILLSWDDTTQVIILVTAGMVAMIVAYYGFGLLAAARRLPTLRIAITPGKRRFYVAASLGFGLLSYWLSVTGLSPDPYTALGEAMRVMSFQANVALALLAIEHYRSNRRDPQRGLILFGALVVLAVLGMTTGQLENAVAPFAIVTIARWQARRRFPFHWLLIGSLLFVMVNSVKADYRTQAFSPGSGVTGVSGRLSLWLSLVGNQWTNAVEGGGGLQPIVAPTTQRLDLVHISTWVYEETPGTVPYHNGSTYQYLLYGWIPRFIFPDKPDSSAANTTFETDYGLLYKWQQIGASIGVGTAAEAYGNFGPAGVVVVLFLQGLFFAVLRRLLEGDVAQAIYIAVLLAFLNGIGTYTAIIFTTAAENALASALLLLLIGAHRARTTGRAVPEAA